MVFVCRHRGTMFIYMMTILTRKVYSIKNKKFNQLYRTEIIDIIIIIVISNI